MRKIVCMIMVCVVFLGNVFAVTVSAEEIEIPNGNNVSAGMWATGSFNLSVSP